MATPTRGPSPALLAIQAGHLTQIAAQMRRDLESLAPRDMLAGLTRDRALAYLVSADVLVERAAAAIRALADQPTTAPLTHQQQGEEACARG